MNIAEYPEQTEAVSVCVRNRGPAHTHPLWEEDLTSTCPTRHSKLALQIMEMTSEKILTKHYL